MQILFILSLLGFILLYILYIYIVEKLKILFGFKQYEYTKILSYGMKKEYMWHETDEKALDYYRTYEFVEEIKPNKRRIKPLN